MSFTAAQLKSVLDEAQASEYDNDDDDYSGSPVKIVSTYGANKGQLEGLGEDDFWYNLGDSGQSGTMTINGETYHWTGVESIGGHEGAGEYAAVIFDVDGRTFRQEGFYASHYGCDYDGTFEEVEKFQKTVDDYRPI